MSESIFKKDDQGNLIFVGDFNSYYSEYEDPWGQSNSNETDMSEYYLHSRGYLIEQIRSLCTDNNIGIAEVGCGLGYILKEMNANFGFAELNGFDISKIAIQKASSLNGNFANFYVHDIGASSLPIRANIVILSNILWYVLDNLLDVLGNSIKSLEPSETGEMHLIIHNAFFRGAEQKYGVEIVSSLNDLVSHLSSSIKRAKHIKLVAINARIISIAKSKYDEVFVMATFQASEL